MNAATSAIYDELTCGSARADEFEVTQTGDILYLNHCDEGWYRVTVEKIDEPTIDAGEYDAFGGRVTA